MRARRPRSQGGSVLARWRKSRAGARRSQGGACQCQTWRCARPRARSPQGDGVPCLPQPPIDALPGCGRDARAPRGDLANSRPGDALVPERGARRATGNDAYPSPQSTLPGCGRDARAPRGACQCQTWRCARPRARSPQGDGTPRLPQPPIDALPGCGRDARAPRGTRPGDALVPERGARRATGCHAYPSHQSTRSPDAGGDAQCHSLSRCSAEAFPREEQARRLRYVGCRRYLHGYWARRPRSQGAR
jgi:hypothetical protein